MYQKKVQSWNGEEVTVLRCGGWSLLNGCRVCECGRKGVRGER